MKIILSFDSFKGCITAQEACHAAAEGIHFIYPDAETVEIPLSDGGEGLVECVSQILPVNEISIPAHGPLMEPITAKYALSHDGTTAYMEMAATSGLPLVPAERRNPMLTTTYGVGEMLIDAYHRHCSSIVMGIGGSATCDGGKGMIQCLQEHNMLTTIHEAYSPNSTTHRLIIATDVTNPLYGENGAAHIFAPQKGATPEQVLLLDQQLRQFAAFTEAEGIATPSLAHYPGTGAAGGLGYGLMAYLNAELRPGIDIILDLLHFDEAILDADLIITGEGKSDLQTLMGKVPHGVLQRAKKNKGRPIPVHLVSGCIEDHCTLQSAGFASIRSINSGDNRSLSILLQPEVAKENIRKSITFAVLQNSD